MHEATNVPGPILSRARPRHHALPLLGLLLAYVAVFAVFILRGKTGMPRYVLRWDFASQYAPWLIYSSDVLRSGSWPLWCPYVGGGVPFFLNPQNPIYSPLTWLVSFTVGYTYYVAQVQSIFILFVAAAGAYALSFELWRSRAGGLVAALAFGLSANIWTNLEHTSFISAFSASPWLFWAVLVFIRYRNRRAFASLVVVLYLLVVTGYPAIVLQTLLWNAAWAVFLLVCAGLNGPQRVEAILKGLAAGVIGLGLAAVYWLPGIACAHEFTRGAGLDLDTALTGGNLHFKTLWSLVFQFLLSSPLPGGEADISMRGLYIGALALPLVAVALATRRDRWSAALGVLSTGAFLMACGSDFFGRTTLHLLLPGLNFARFPAADSRALMALGLALLAGRGMVAVAAGDDGAQRVGRRGFYVLIGVLLLGLGWFTSYAQAGRLAPDAFGNGPLNAITATLLFTALALAIWPSIASRTGRAAFVALLLVDLGTAFHANIAVAGEKSDAGTNRESVHHRTFETAPALLPRERGTGGNLLLPSDCEPANNGCLSKTFYVGEYNPLRMLRFDRLIRNGFEGWMLTGDRVVALAWRSDKPPASAKDFGTAIEKLDYSILTYGPNSVRYRINLPQKSWVIFNEVYFDGWKARWQGHDVPGVEVLGGLRAAVLDAGEGDLVTWFHPRILFVSAGISVASLLAGVLLLPFLRVRVP